MSRQSVEQYIEEAKETRRKTPRLNLPCCTCGEVIASRSYQTVAPPGGRARGLAWPQGLHRHMRCRVGMKRWYESLGRPVRGFSALFSAEKDAEAIRLYKDARFNEKGEPEEEDTPDLEDQPQSGSPT